jgi:6-phosphogluconolactonase
MPSPWRVTLTLPVLNASREVLFLVAGADKATAVKRILEDASDAEDLPADHVRPAGRLLWLLDRAAAGE